MIMPSMTECGSPSSTERSMNAPGSPSSALQTTYLTSPFCAAANDHLSPVGKPAPPRPREPRSLHLLDDLVGRHLEERLAERLVAAGRLVLLDRLGVDDAAVAQHDAHLGLLVRRLGAAELAPRLDAQRHVLLEDAVAPRRAHRRSCPRAPASPRRRRCGCRRPGPRRAARGSTCRCSRRS